MSEGGGGNAPTRLACGHSVAITPGERLFCHYDVSFGVVAMEPDSAGWATFIMDGSPYKAAGRTGFYNAERLACVPCGVRDVERRHNDPLHIDEDWEILRLDAHGRVVR